MLTIESLNQYYGGSHILRNVSMTVPEGKLTVLLGRNGVGKTTLLRCLMGVVPAKSGSIAWNDHVLTKLPTWARVANGLAYVPQGRDIFGRLTVEENLLVGAASKKCGPSRVPEQIYALFPVLKDMKARRGGDLSGGQQQQLAIGRALMSEPQLLILDEPTEGIQPSIIQDIGRTLRQGPSTGTSVFSSQSFLKCSICTQFSNPSCLARAFTASSDEYFGRNCFR